MHLETTKSELRYLIVKDTECAEILLKSVDSTGVKHLWNPDIFVNHGKSKTAYCFYFPIFWGIWAITLHHIILICHRFVPFFSYITPKVFSCPNSSWDNRAQVIHIVIRTLFSFSLRGLHPSDLGHLFIQLSALPFWGSLSLSFRASIVLLSSKLCLAFSPFWIWASFYSYV